MKKTYLTLLACFFATIMMAQQQFEVQVSASTDDVEERLPGDNQPNEVGSMDIESSDLELGSEGTGNESPQLVGIRFTGVDLPQGAVILDARIVFTVDNTNKNVDPTNVFIKAQDADNPATFADAAFDVSSRATLADSVDWSIAEGSWTEIGAAGADQTTPNIAVLVQQLVNKGGWAAGNAMVFTIQGVGLREADSYDGSPEGAAKLVVDYLTPGMAMIQLSSDTDDAEEKVNDGSMDLSSSDIELGIRSR